MKERGAVAVLEEKDFSRVFRLRKRRPNFFRPSGSCKCSHELAVLRNRNCKTAENSYSCQPAASLRSENLFPPCLPSGYLCKIILPPQCRRCPPEKSPSMPVPVNNPVENHFAPAMQPRPLVAAVLLPQVSPTPSSSFLCTNGARTVSGQISNKVKS